MLIGKILIAIQIIVFPLTILANNKIKDTINRVIPTVVNISVIGKCKIPNSEDFPTIINQGSGFVID